MKQELPWNTWVTLAQRARILWVLIRLTLQIRRKKILGKNETGYNAHAQSFHYIESWVKSWLSKFRTPLTLDRPFQNLSVSDLITKVRSENMNFCVTILMPVGFSYG